MGFGPNGLSRGCKVIYSRVDLTCAERIRVGTSWRDAFMAWAIIARPALSPSTPRAKGAPLRASGGDSESAAKQRTPMPKNGKERVSVRSERRGRSGDIGDGLLRAEWVVEGLQGLLLQVEVSEIVMHEADEPNAVVDFLDAELLAGQHG